MNLRAIADPFVAAAPSGARVRTRLRVDDTDAVVLTRVGGLLGSLAGRDRAARCREGRLDAKSKARSRQKRKKTSTSESSSRWAGAITCTSEDQYRLAEQNLWAQPASLARLQSLTTRLDAVDADLIAGTVHVVRGGKALLHKRNNLDDAGLTVQQWRQQWTAARLFLTADGKNTKHGATKQSAGTPMRASPRPDVLTGPRRESRRPTIVRGRPPGETQFRPVSRNGECNTSNERSCGTEDNSGAVSGSANGRMCTGTCRVVARRAQRKRTFIVARPKIFLPCDFAATAMTPERAAGSSDLMSPLNSMSAPSLAGTIAGADSRTA